MWRWGAHDSAPLTRCRSHRDTYVVAVTPLDVNRVETLCVATLPHATTQQTFGNGILGSLDHRRGCALKITERPLRH